MVLRDMPLFPDMEPGMLEQADRSATIAAMVASLNMACFPWIAALNPAVVIGTTCCTCNGYESRPHPVCRTRRRDGVGPLWPPALTIENP